MKAGDYYKLVGSYEGAVFTGKHWSRFDCDGCVRQAGIAKNRLQGTMSPGAAEAMRGPVHHRHDVETHKQYVQSTRHVYEDSTPSQMFGALDTEQGIQGGPLGEDDPTKKKQVQTIKSVVRAKYKRKLIQ